MQDAGTAAEAVARAAYGRLLAFLVARSRDVAAAEDALADAFGAALATWPVRGVPSRPEAWLFAVARRNLIRAGRRAVVQAAGSSTLRLLAEERHDVRDDGIPDERLKLLFVCAHPAIDASARAPLMLQTVLGLDAGRIASAFLTAPATMGQRLVRAKMRIRDTGLAFAVPEPAELPARLAAVLEAIYAAYGSGWDDVAGADARRKELAAEAIWLARVVVTLMPGAAEANGLLALMLYCEARKEARRSPQGAFVPLSEQDPALWSRPMLAEAERLLAAAGRLAQIGRFQLEAAIQSAHVQRAVTGATDWAAVAVLYDGLVALAPTVGALIGRAAARAELLGAEAALLDLDAVPAVAVLTYQPYWALRAHLLARLGRTDAAETAYATAIGLAEDPAVRSFLLARSKACRGAAADPIRPEHG